MGIFLITILTICFNANSESHIPPTIPPAVQSLLENAKEKPIDWSEKYLKRRLIFEKNDNTQRSISWLESFPVVFDNLLIDGKLSSKSHLSLSKQLLELCLVEKKQFNGAAFCTKKVFKSLVRYYPLDIWMDGFIKHLKGHPKDVTADIWEIIRGKVGKYCYNSNNTFCAKTILGLGVKLDLHTKNLLFLSLGKHTEAKNNRMAIEKLGNTDPAINLLHVSLLIMEGKFENAIKAIKCRESEFEISAGCLILDSIANRKLNSEKPFIEPLKTLFNKIDKTNYYLRFLTLIELAIRLNLNTKDDVKVSNDHLVSMYEKINLPDYMKNYQDFNLLIKHFLRLRTLSSLDINRLKKKLHADSLEFQTYYMKSCLNDIKIQ